MTTLPATEAFDRAIARARDALRLGYGDYLVTNPRDSIDFALATTLTAAEEMLGALAPEMQTARRCAAHSHVLQALLLLVATSDAQYESTMADILTAGAGIN